jgi:threonine aldolase
MYDAEVGDDVFGEDPTVALLEETVADLLGKEAALFVPTGTMGNQLAIRSHTSPGDEVIVDRSSHVFNYESGAASSLSGVQLHPLDGPGGFMEADMVESAVRHGYYWETPTRLICIENTLNKAGGRIIPEALIQSVAAVAERHQLPMHLDGARLWNAAIASNRSIDRMAAPFKSVTVCLSKGLGAPIGSVLTGPAEFIGRAHRYRKMYGGGMRQVGVIAAAGLYALKHNIDRLSDDHENARVLAEGLADATGIDIDPAAVDTNIVMFGVRRDRAIDVVAELAAAGVLVIPFGPSTIRATTHKDVTAKDVTDAIKIIRQVTVSTT